MKIGSLFTGYGGLDRAVETVTGAHTVWVSDIDKGANKILTHRYPNIPNLGDITQIDWNSVEPVDILTGGFPCQDLSHAGKRAGLKNGTRSGLWSHMAEAVKQLQPRLVVAENVRGLLSAYAPGDVEPCALCVGDQPTTDLRALGVVLADLAGIGYDAQWCGLRAADVGACHGRFRVFLIAYPAGQRLEGSESQRVREPISERIGNCGGDTLNLLPTPVVNDMGAGKTPSEWSEWSEAMKARHGNGNGHGASLSIEAQLLPTPMAAEGIKPSNTMGLERRLETGQPFLTNVVVSLAGLDPSEPVQERTSRFGDYTPAVERWAQVIGEPAPDPTAPTGRNKRQMLSAKFVEWMMGLPADHVTDVPGLSRNEALKALGNGVVPLQAETALRHMLGGSS